MLDMCNYFFSNFFKSPNMSVAKGKVAQNRHVCEFSKRNCMLYCIEILYSLREARHIEIPVDVLCDFSFPNRSVFFSPENSLK